MAEEAPARKGPGRPRKRPQKPAPVRAGIAKTPSDPAIFMEMVYDQPLILRKIFGMFKQMEIRDRVFMSLTRDGLFMFVIAHSKKTVVRIYFDGSKINRYYCAEAKNIDLNAADIETINQLLAKSCALATFILETNNVRSSMKIVFKMENGAEKERRINVLDHDVFPAASFDDEKYPIKLDISSSAFKDHINDISKIADEGLFQIMQAGNRPLELVYHNKGESIRARDRIEGDDCKIVSNLRHDQVVSATLLSEHLSPISASLLADKWSIAVDSIMPLLIRGIIDKGAVILDSSTSIDGDDEHNKAQ